MKLLSLSNKKGVSLLISYVLLISISIALSVLVYNWLRFYVQETELEKCKEGIAIVIQDYECFLANGGVDGSLNITIKNKGRFNIDGFVLKVNDRAGAKIGLYNFTNDGEMMVPAQVVNRKFDFSEVDMNTSTLIQITMIEVQPFVLEGSDRTYCEKISSQSVECF